MRYLNQVLAIEQELRPRTARALTEAHHALQRPAMLEGLHGVYEPNHEDGEKLPDEHQRVMATVPEMIERTREALEKLFDVTAARDFTNAGDTDACADVVVDGTVLIEKAPATYLLWLDKQLDDLNTFVSKLPTLDPGAVWELDDPRGVYKSHPVRTERRVQQPRTHVVFAPTEHQPGQAQVFTENVQVGIWTRHKFSGAIPVSERAGLQRRIQKLKAAVVSARQSANRVEAKDPRPGAAVLNFIFG